MKQKLLLLILFIILFLPIGLCDKIENNIDNIDNTKIYNDKEKLISIYDKNNDKSMDIKLIYTSFDINKMVEIVEIINYIEYIPNKNQDFITKSKIKYGKNDIYKSEYFIEKYNYDNISIRKEIYNNKTKENESIIINKIVINNTYWKTFNPYDKEILKNETFKLKIIHYKKPELGFFKIQTIPIFKNIECKEFTWWMGNWDLKRAILINNTIGDYVTDYQLKSVNLSIYQINASSCRIINETSGLLLNHWNVSIDDNGNIILLWVNFTEILNNTWVNNIYSIYHQSIPNVSSSSNGELTFIQYHENAINTYHDSNIFLNNIIYESKLKHTSSTHNILFGCSNEVGTGSDALQIQSYNLYNLRYFYSKNNGVSTSVSETPIFPINTNVYLKIIFNELYTCGYVNNNEISNGITINLPNENMGLWMYIVNGNVIQNYAFIRKYTENEPELWTVGEIEYPEGIEMNCSINIITHLTEKQIKTTYTNGSIINESLSNMQINLPYDSYIVYMSNPVKITSITSLFNTMDNILIQFFLFVLIIIISITFVLFLNIIKNKGFKGVTR